MTSHQTCRHCGAEIYPSEGHWRNTAFNGRDPQFHCAAPHETFHEPASDSVDGAPGPGGDVDENSQSLTLVDREVLAREIVAGLRSHGEGCTCAAWASMECGCPEALWPEHFVSDAADLIEALLGHVGPVLPDTVTITMTRAEAQNVAEYAVPGRVANAVRVALAELEENE